MTTRKTKVVFDEVEILEFNRILGDNPGVSAGAPIALGDKLQNTITLNVDIYETTRGRRKSRKKLSLPVQERAQLLLQQGYSLHDIANATLEADSIARRRVESASKQNWDKVNEVSERFARLFTKKRSVPEKSTLAATSA